MQRISWAVFAAAALVLTALVACAEGAATPDASPTTLAPAPSQAQATPISPTPTRSGHAKPSAAVPLLTKSFPAPPDLDLYRAAAELVPGIGEIERLVNPQPVSYDAGRRDTFWLVDLDDLKAYQSEFELRLVTPHAYWYIEDGQNVDQKQLEAAAAEFEDLIYPGVTGVFGQEWLPGIDNDPHLNILNARLSNVGGYFSSGDSYPTAVRKHSNQREVIYVNTGAIPVGSSAYSDVLAHELQHAVHWNADASEDSWVNEGLAELAASLTGKRTGSVSRFLRSKPTSLVNWPITPVAGLANYGSSSLFMHYLTEHYADRSDLRPLIRQGADGIAGIDAFLAEQGHGIDFEGVFRDWTVANLLDEETGLYGYGELDVTVSPSLKLEGFEPLSSQIPQYAAEYVDLKSLDGPVVVEFQGNKSARLFPVDVSAPGCWWGNAGDSIDSRLSRAVDLRGLEEASLSYEAWFSVEEGWDYAYVQVSTDGGRTWSILETPNSTPENPVGASFGPGYSGESEGWLRESVQLDDFAGQEIWVRFQYITDDAINGPGICLRDLTIMEAGITAGDDGWVADGFVFTSAVVRQDYAVQLVLGEDGAEVVQMQLDATNSGSLTIANAGERGRIVAVVSAQAPATRELAAYTLRVRAAD